METIRLGRPRAIFVISQKGNKMIKFKGYTYSAMRGLGAKVRWRCSTHHNHGCKAVVITVEDQIISVKDDHNHLSQSNCLSKGG
ncbi:hypothetical protein EVAR_17889_1 [Eumeta japonica]|uniref:FLYWCH-type domain-containing protein n=1 Tax=Eumeta variegata TaxID=151549 RepID=A0A4C1UY33_EUMVA|nr:hypothetical protein EVAR_17889_1 [Eumeta japonica]